MTWRERIAAARERGHFTEEDIRLGAGAHARPGGPGPFAYCAVGEQADRYGAELIFGHPTTRWVVKDDVLRDLGGTDGFTAAVQANDFDKAERLLDAIEDRALALKRVGLDADEARALPVAHP